MARPVGIAPPDLDRRRGQPAVAERSADQGWPTAELEIIYLPPRASGATAHAVPAAARVAERSWEASEAPTPQVREQPDPAVRLAQARYHLRQIVCYVLGLAVSAAYLVGSGTNPFDARQAQLEPISRSLADLVAAWHPATTAGHALELILMLLTLVVHYVVSLGGWAILGATFFALSGDLVPPERMRAQPKTP